MSPLPVHPDIERRANDVLRKSGFPRISNGIGIDVQRVAEEFYKLDVRFVPNLRFNGRPMLGAYIPTFPYVLIDRSSIATRQRFSIAHELGHAELEDDFGNAESLFKVRNAFLCVEEDADPKLARRSENSVGMRRRREIRANQFAVRIIMPSGLVREVWRDDSDIYAVSEALAVSVEALGYRLLDLGLSVPETTLRALPLERQ